MGRSDLEPDRHDLGEVISTAPGWRADGTPADIHGEAAGWLLRGQTRLRANLVRIESGVLRSEMSHIGWDVVNTRVRRLS
jgi:hypothetical protein